MFDEIEEWRQVVGFESWYEVSDLGRIRHMRPSLRKPSERIVGGGLNRAGYREVGLIAGSRRRTATVHSLVAAAFIGPRPTGLQIDHVDGNKLNNRAVNLEYVTGLENVRRAVALGLFRGSASRPRQRTAEESAQWAEAAGWTYYRLFHWYRGRR